MRELKPRVKIFALYFLRVSIFILFCALGAVPFYVLFDYIKAVQDTPGDISIPIGLAKGLVVMLGSVYALIGAWIGWKLRTHSIYNDILDIDTPVKQAEAEAALRDHGVRNGWRE